MKIWKAKKWNHRKSSSLESTSGTRFALISLASHSFVPFTRKICQIINQSEGENSSNFASEFLLLRPGPLQWQIKLDFLDTYPCQKAEEKRIFLQWPQRKSGARKVLGIARKTIFWHKRRDLEKRFARFPLRTSITKPKQRWWNIFLSLFFASNLRVSKVLSQAQNGSGEKRKNGMIMSKAYKNIFISLCASRKCPSWNQGNGTMFLVHNPLEPSDKSFSGYSFLGMGNFRENFLRSPSTSTARTRTTFENRTFPCRRKVPETQKNDFFYCSHNFFMSSHQSQITDIWLCRRAISKEALCAYDGRGDGKKGKESRENSAIITLNGERHGDYACVNNYLVYSFAFSLSAIVAHAFREKPFAVSPSPCHSRHRNLVMRAPHDSWCRLFRGAIRRRVEVETDLLHWSHYVISFEISWDYNWLRVLVKCCADNWNWLRNRPQLINETHM